MYGRYGSTKRNSVGAHVPLPRTILACSTSQYPGPALSRIRAHAQYAVSGSSPRPLALRAWPAAGEKRSGSGSKVTCVSVESQSSKVTSEPSGVNRAANKFDHCVGTANAIYIHLCMHVLEPDLFRHPFRQGSS